MPPASTPPSPPPLPVPSGTVTFLFTDIEGSTRLWETRPDEMRVALTRHDELLHQAISRHNGYVFKTVGDAFCAAFTAPPDAVRVCLDVQAVLTSEYRDHPERLPLPLKVRMALHSGLAEERSNDYFGPALNRVARLLSTGYGGQVLLSAAAQELCRDLLPADAALRDLGMHRLKDLGRAEQVYQLLHPDLPADFPPLKSLDVQRHNLPLQLTSFIGREQEMATVRALLTRSRLVTLIGAGGSGKTRLSLQVGADALDEERFPDGVWFVDLAPISEASAVDATVARTLGISETAERTAAEEVIAFLSSRRLLLLLDNCEHLLSACARFADDLLRLCPQVTLLATSREALGILGETTYRVPSLSAPDPDAQTTATAAQAGLAFTLTRYESVALFVERARAAKPDFAVTDANATAVASLCWRLDGIPLALELAAARVRALPVEEIAARLDQRFRLLTTGNRAALPRQQTLRAAVDWSYDLLDEPEKTLLMRLSVFAGGWTLAACETICGYTPLEEWEVVELLSHLVEKSLVVLNNTGDSAEALDSNVGGDGPERATRYRLLETMRAYALEKHHDAVTPTATAASDAEPPEMLAVRHRDYYLSRVEDFSDPVYRRSGGFAEWLAVLEAERGNIRAALQFSEQRVAQGQEAAKDALLRFWPLWHLWYFRGSLRDGVAWMEKLAALADPDQDPKQAADIYQAAAQLLELVTRFDDAAAAWERAIACYRSVGNQDRVAFALSALGETHLYRGDNTRAEELSQQALHLARDIGARPVESMVLNSLGMIAIQRGDYEAAIEHFEQSLAADEGRDVGAPHARNYLNRAEAHLFLGQRDAACRLYLQARRTAAAIGHRGIEIVATEGLAQILADDGYLEDALLLLAASDAGRERYSLPRTPQQSPFYDQTISAVRAGLDERAYHRVEQAGRQMTIADAFAVASTRLNVGEEERTP